MSQEFDELIFERFVSIESIVSLISLKEIKKRGKDTIDQKPQDQKNNWITKHLKKSGFTIYFGPWRYDKAVCSSEADPIYWHLHKFFKDILENGERRTTHQRYCDMLAAIPDLHAKLRDRIVTAVLRGILQEYHIEYYIDIAKQAKNPGGLVQSRFRFHLQERYNHEDLRVTIAREIDAYITEQQ